MNHQEFRMFVKAIPADVIKSYNIKPAYFKAICLVLSMYGDYETGTSIRPSWLTIAKEAGVDRKTAMKVRDLLISKGILVQDGLQESNIAIYHFGAVVHLEPQQLSIYCDQLSITREQLSSIDGHNITYNITTNTKEIILHEDSNESSENQEDLVEPLSLDNKYITPEEMYQLTSHLWE